MTQIIRPLVVDGPELLRWSMHDVSEQGQGFMGLMKIEEKNRQAEIFSLQCRSSHAKEEKKSFLRDKMTSNPHNRIYTNAQGCHWTWERDRPVLKNRHLNPSVYDISTPRVPYSR